MKRFTYYVDSDIYQQVRFRSYVKATEYANFLSTKLKKPVWVFHQNFKYKANHENQNSKPTN